MPGNTITIAFNGDVTLTDYSAALDEFARLVDGLTRELASGADIKWTVDGLETGSCIATCRGESKASRNGPAVGLVVRGYEKTAHALMSNSAIPYSDQVRKPAIRLVNRITGSIRSIRFETEEFDAEITGGQDAMSLPEEFDVNFGAVTGRIQSISNRQTLRFTLYDDLDDHAISCYLKPGSEDVMRESWGKIATVEGMVRRNVATGRASVVRDVAIVSVVDEGGPDDFRMAIGCAPAIPGSMTPEEAIRKIRDA